MNGGNKYFLRANEWVDLKQIAPVSIGQPIYHPGFWINATA